MRIIFISLFFFVFPSCLVTCSTNFFFESQGNKKAQQRNKKARDALVRKTFTGMSATDVELSCIDLFKIVSKMPDDVDATRHTNKGDIVRAGTFPLPCTQCGYLRNIGEFTPLQCACDWYATNGSKNQFFPKKKVECGACRMLRFNNGKFIACHCVMRTQRWCRLGPEHWRDCYEGHALGDHLVYPTLATPQWGGKAGPLPCCGWDIKLNIWDALCSVEWKFCWINPPKAVDAEITIN